MNPEISKSLTELIAAITSGMVALIGAYVAYKVREMQQDKKAAAKDKHVNLAVSFLDGLIKSTVAYINQTSLPEKPPEGFSPTVQVAIKAKAVNYILNKLPATTRDRLIEFMGSDAELKHYIEFRVESEVFLQKRVAQ
jgi:hypothetical protein